jgi:hypothetical protein
VEDELPDATPDPIGGYEEIELEELVHEAAD